MDPAYNFSIYLHNYWPLQWIWYRHTIRLDSQYVHKTVSDQLSSMEQVPMNGISKKLCIIS